MRSSVSVILSDPAPDNTMAFPDYQQTCQDHARLLVLVTRIGHQVTENTFDDVFSVIQQVDEVEISDKHGGTRTIGVRYTSHYPVENNDWGEFQAHRKVLGVITVGACSNQIELNELCRLHEAFKTKYNSTVYDTRCVVFCERTQVNGSDQVNAEDETDHQSVHAPTNGEVNKDEEGQPAPDTPGLDKPPPWFQPQNHKTRLLIFRDAKYSAGLRTDIQDFVGSLFWILESKRVEWSREGPDRIPLLCAPFERKDFVGLDMDSRNNRKRILGRQKKHLGDLSLQAGLPAEAWNYYQVSHDVLRPANDWLWLASCLEGLCAVSVVLQDKQHKGAIIGSTGLSCEEMVERYRECVHHYAKYKHAGIIETEASLKAVQILIKHRSYLLASEFLQNIVFINLHLTDQEKIERFVALSKLYDQIGFKRKAAFFQRVAAMRCVAPQNPHHNWAACYSLMLDAVKGYSLELEICDKPKEGWSTLQVQLLQELVGTSRKVGHHAASTRHMAFLLQCLYSCLSGAERQDFAAQLSVLSQRAPLTQATISIPNGISLPPVNLYCLPKVMKFEVTCLPSQLAPVKLESTAPTVSGPFLFTPIQTFGGSGRGSARSSGRMKARRPVTWVQDDPGQVTLHAVNTLGVEVRVTNFTLITDGGVAFQVEPSITVLTGDTRPQTVLIRGVPRSQGTLRILGYSHTVLGITSLCHLKNLTFCDEEEIKVEVLPPLPQVDIWLERKRTIYDKQESNNQSEASTTNQLTHADGQPVSKEGEGDQPAAGDGSNPKDGKGEERWSRIESLSLYSGEEEHLRLVISNIGNVRVTRLELDWICDEGEKPTVEIHQDSLNSHLPLKPGDTVHAEVVLRGSSKLSYRPDDSISVTCSESRWSNSGPSSLPNRHSFLSVVPGEPGHPPVSYSSSLMSRGGSETMSDTGVGPFAVSQLTLPAIIRLRASVEGVDCVGWCRRAETTINLSQLTSLVITRWDVLAGDKEDNFFLVLDLLNRTEEEMELTYAGKKQLLIEPGDMCRVPVPVEKCSFSESLDWKEGSQQIKNYIQERVHLLWAVGDLPHRRSGSVSLETVVWTDCMLEIMRLPPLMGRLEVAGTGGEEVTARAGELLQVDVELLNILSEPVTQCSLSVRVQQDSVGVHSMGNMGTPGVYLMEELAPEATLRHTTHLLPLSPGQYTINATVSLVFREKVHSWRLSQLQLSVSL